MHFVVMGCGRVGASLARAIERAGHRVAVIDQDAAAFARLGPTSRADRITGVGFDRDTLKEAEIERATAFAAVSSGDNSNILAARVARETFGVPTVVARIYDPARAEIYQRLGIPTVATVRWTTDQIMRRLLPTGQHTLLVDPSGRLAVTEVPTAPAWVGQRYTHLEQATGGRVAWVTRLGEAMLPQHDLVHQEGDLVHLILPQNALERAESVLAAPPPHD